MKRSASFLIVIGFLVVFAGCKKQVSDTDAVRSGINQHLASLKTINLGAMDMTVTNVTVQGNTAQAQVEFRPKGAAPQSPAMQVAYTLEKQNGVWAVQNTQAAGGMMQSPAPGENPAANSATPQSGSMPNFREVVPGGAAPTALPPGHPPVNGQGTTQQQ